MGSQLKRLEGEIQVVGIDAGELSVEKWLQGAGTSFSGGEATLLVFWEAWCPHSKRVVPKLQSTYEAYKNRGLQVVGLTKATRNTTDEEIQRFITDKMLSYPIGKERGDEMSKRFGVRGIPAAAVVKDGKVVWRGHPAKADDALLERLLGSSSEQTGVDGQVSTATNEPTPSEAKPSFDCNKASHNVEILICSDLELATLDREMGEVFVTAKSRIEDRSAFVRDQREWIANRNAKCKVDDVENPHSGSPTVLECLKTETTSRRDALKGM